MSFQPAPWLRCERASEQTRSWSATGPEPGCSQQDGKHKAGQAVSTPHQAQLQQLKHAGISPRDAPGGWLSPCKAHVAGKDWVTLPRLVTAL